MWAHGAPRRVSGSHSDNPVRRHPFAAVNLISDPIHGYIELTKRLTPAETAAAGLPDEDVAEEDLLDTAWLQRLRRIVQTFRRVRSVRMCRSDRSLRRKSRI